MQDRFQDSRVLVTAGASGIGRAIAMAFASEGAMIHIVDIDPDAIDRFRQLTGKYQSVETSMADVSDETAVQSVFELQREKFGGIDILINCAGIKGPLAQWKNYYWSTGSAVWKSIYSLHFFVANMRFRR